VAETIRFESGAVDLDWSRNSVNYQGFNHIAINQKAVLPARQVYIALRQGEELTQLTWQTVDSQILGANGLIGYEADIPTGSYDLYRDEPTARSQTENLGHYPIQVTGEFRLDDRCFVGLLILPVYMDETGTLLLATSLEIRIGTRFLTEEDFLDRLPDTDQSRDNLQLASGSANVEYLIVTDESLADPVERLARYKNAVGIITEIAYIEDILNLYSGRDDAESLREYLKDFYAEGGRYVCLAGDEIHLPVRYAYPGGSSDTPDTTDMQLCDLYFADLTGDWDYDGDNLWGERYVDQVDLEPELIVGRLPFADTVQMSAYVDKLIMYETNPGHGDFDYLTRAFFFSSDQMRDYPGGGQHAYIAAAYPDRFEIDTTVGVEISRGDDMNPYNESATELEPTMSDGFGIINVVSHGMSTRFEVRTTGYNGSPRSYFTSDTLQTTQGQTSRFNTDGRVGLFYSLACNNGAWDLDAPDLPANVSVALLVDDDAGAVACVANSRWGWVGSSYLLQATFFDSLFAHPERSAAEAMYASKACYTYYTDLLYGQNFLGDPTLKIYNDTPRPLTINEIPGLENIEVYVTSRGLPVENCRVLLSDSLGVIGEVTTNVEGKAVLELNFTPGADYSVAAIKTGYCNSVISHSPSIVSDVDDDDLLGLPRQFALAQNYPNPFNPNTTIDFNLARRSEVTLEVFNILGERVVTLVDAILPAGRHSVQFEAVDDTGRPIASGVYLYRLTTSEFVSTKKMMLLR